jgi:hypothetical protein
MNNNFLKFKNTWEEEIKKIENAVIDDENYLSIINRFRIDKNLLYINIPDYETSLDDILSEVTSIESKLINVLGRANTKFKLQNRSLLLKFAENLTGFFSKVLEVVVNLLNLVKRV